MKFIENLTKVEIASITYGTIMVYNVITYLYEDTKNNS